MGTRLYVVGAALGLCCQEMCNWRTWVIGACSSPRGWSGTGTGSPASGHSPKASRTQGAFGQCSQGQGGIVGVSCAGPGLVLSDPWGTLPTRHILWFLIGGLWLPSFFGTGPYLKPHSWLGSLFWQNQCCVALFGVQILFGWCFWEWLVGCWCVSEFTVLRDTKTSLDLILLLAMLRKENQGDFERTVVKVDSIIDSVRYLKILLM